MKRNQVSCVFCERNSKDFPDAIFSSSPEATEGNNAVTCAACLVLMYHRFHRQRFADAVNSGSVKNIVPFARRARPAPTLEVMA